MNVFSLIHRYLNLDFETYFRLQKKDDVMNMFQYFRKFIIMDFQCIFLGFNIFEEYL